MCLSVPIEDCTINANCTLNVITGYTGSDQHGNTFTTATMIDQINKYSAATLYNNFAQGVSCCFWAWLRLLQIDLKLESVGSSRP